MYKITLFDYNCASCTSGTASFYVDDIDIFEEKWSKLERSPERIERFRRSKNGEVVTDYYSDDEELNIVQEDKNAEILHEKHLLYHNKRMSLVNAYWWEGLYNVRDLDIHIRYVKFKGEYIKMASFIAQGISTYSMFDGEKKFHRIMCFGNPVLNMQISEDSPSTSKRLSDYDNDVVESFVFLPINEYKTLNQMQKYFDSKRLSTNERYRLLFDIPGDEG